MTLRAPKSAPGGPAGTFLAGAAETIVTPPAEGTFLVGPMKPSTGVHDDLWARALVLSDGRTRAALITMDWLGFDFAYQDLLVAAIAEATGIPAPHILINCSHTHNSPLTAPWGPWEKAKDKPFHEALPGKLAEIAREAAAALRPARLRYAREPVQIGFNRRTPTPDKVTMAPNPAGAVLPWTDVLAAEGAGGTPLAVLFTYAAHPVIVHAASTLISADYPGFAVQTMREARGAAGGIFLFAQGCGGNVNAFPLKGGLEAARAAGRDLGQAVLRALEAPGDPLRPGSLRVAAQDLVLPLQAPPPAREVRRKLAAETDAGRRAHLEKLLALAESGAQPSMRFPIRALALGKDLAILALPHEPFAEYALFAEKASPLRHTMVLGYTGGLECYVGTAKDYRLGERGGYETSPRGAAAMYEALLPLAPEAEGLIRRGIAAALRALKAGRRGKAAE
jgi:hypothetical protein